jgi:hypothetical protein
MLRVKNTHPKSAKSTPSQNMLQGLKTYAILAQHGVELSRKWHIDDTKLEKDQCDLIYQPHIFRLCFTHPIHLHFSQ